jgi:DNA-binding transcriptional regulator YiaG
MARKATNGAVKATKLSATKLSTDWGAVRRKLGLSQSEFWGPIGVTQSGGSRYENDRKVPRPVDKMLTIAYASEKQSAAEVKRLRK